MLFQMEYSRRTIPSLVVMVSRDRRKILGRILGLLLAAFEEGAHSIAHELAYRNAAIHRPNFDLLVQISRKANVG